VVGIDVVVWGWEGMDWASIASGWLVHEINIAIAEPARRIPSPDKSFLTLAPLCLK